MKKFLAFFLSVVTVLSLSGCGLIEKLPLGGLVGEKYSCVGIAGVGETQWQPPEDEILIELDSDGDATFLFEEYEYNLRWEKDEDGNIEMKMGSETVISGTLENGVMQVMYGEVMLLLTKPGAEAPESTLYWNTETEPPVSTEDKTEPVSTQAPVTAATEATEPTESSTETQTEIQTEPPVEIKYPYIGEQLERDGFTFAVAGIELVEDGLGMTALRYYYDFTNTADEPMRPQEHVICDIYQNGELCTYAWMELPDEFTDKYQISDLLVRPGCTVRCMEQFEIDPEGGLVDLIFTSGSLPETYEIAVDPKDLPGVPEEFELELVPSPEWTNDLYDGGIYNGNFYVYIDRGEIVEGIEGESIFRVYFDFTNNSSEGTSFWINSFIHAYQDGLELRSGYPLTYVAEDQKFYENVDPGETVSVSVCFTLRSESNVEIELENFMTDDGANLGCNFIVAQ